MYEDIQEILEANGITYTTTQIQAFYNEALKLVNIPLLTPTSETDYQHEFQGDTYLTKFCPLLNGTVNLTIDNKKVTPVYVETNSGIIHLPREYSGTLRCTYTCGVPSEEVLADLTPIILSLILTGEGKSVASISEGDVSVSYNGGLGSGDTTSLDALVKNVRNKYDCMVRVI